MTTPSYDKPPVSEGLIDIRIEPLPTTQVSTLQSLHEKIRDDYPEVRSRKQWEGSWQVKDDSMSSAQKAHGITGYLYESGDKKRVIQYRLDGFTCNFLKPDPYEAWPGWNQLRDEARRTWDIYAKAVGVKEVTRLAVRYINKIVIPGPVAELYEYLTVPPSVPKDFEYQNLTNFLSLVAVSIPDLNAIATITQAPAPDGRTDAIILLLDIEVAKLQQIPSSSDAIWPTLDKFREIKNSIFQKSLTPKAEELFNEQSERTRSSQ